LTIPTQGTFLYSVDGLSGEFCNLLGIHFFRLLERVLCFALLGSAVRYQEKQMPFLAADWRSAVRAVKDAGFGVHRSAAKILDSKSARSERTVWSRKGRREERRGSVAAVVGRYMAAVNLFGKAG
jgi:hypothetical protein